MRLNPLGFIFTLGARRPLEFRPLRSLSIEVENPSPPPAMSPSNHGILAKVKQMWNGNHGSS